MRKLLLFIFSFIVWILLVWPFDPETGSVYLEDVGVGLIVAGMVALVMKDIGTDNLSRWLQPKRYFWFICYVSVFTYYVILANLDVAYRVLHPAMPIKPGIVKVKTILKTPSAITVLANSVTLTPGTLTVDVSDDHHLYIHWINVRSIENQEAAEIIIGRFERLIQKIFE